MTLLLWLISCLLMCQLNRAASIQQSKPNLTGGNCSNFVTTPLDFVNIENFRSNVKQELKRLNCTSPGIINVTEADLENPKKDPKPMPSSEFCYYVQTMTGWKMMNSSLFPNLHHLERIIFLNKTLCIVVCTTDLNETVWPYCEAVRKQLGYLSAPPKEVTKQSQLPPNHAMGNSQERAPDSVISPQKGSDSVVNPRKSSDSVINPQKGSDSVVSPQKGSESVMKPQKGSESVISPQNGPDLGNNPHDDAADLADQMKDPSAQAPPDAEEDRNEAKKQEELNPDDRQLEEPSDDEMQIPLKPDNKPDSSKKTVPQETINTSNLSGEHPAPAKVPSESVPQAAIVAGSPNLRPETDESHYFIYFVVMSILCIFCYISIYNKKKILALLIEGRKQKDRRRHASAGYRKLNTNLEEVMPLGTPAPANDSLIY